MRNLLLPFLLVLSACTAKVTHDASLIQTQEFNRQLAAEQRLAVAIAYMQSQRPTDAKRNLDVALNYNPKFAEAHSVLGIYYQSMGQMLLAKQAFERAISLDSKNSGYYNNLGGLLCKLGKLTEAQESFEIALSLTGTVNGAHVYENSVACYLAFGELELALAELQKLITVQPHNQFALISLAEYYWQKKQIAKADQYIQRLLDETPLTAESIWLAYRVAAYKDMKQQAANWLTQLLDRFPDSSISKAYLGTLKNDRTE